MVRDMGRYVTVSAKVKTSLWERIKKFNINVSEVIRRALEEEVMRMEEKELAEELEEIGKTLSIHTDKKIVELIRSSREER